MFGHQFRSQVAGKVDSAIDGLIQRLRHMFTTEHNEDGTHRGVTYSGTVTNITVVNGIVTKVS